VSGNGNDSVRPPRGLQFWAIIVVLYTILILGALELAGQIGFRLRRGFWLAQWDTAYSGFFYRHPFLAVAPKPNARGAYLGKFISHNSLGYRGREFALHKRAGVRRVIAFGGSSTYCSSVSNDDTWPARLQEELGPGFEVINAGCLGYTTVENLIQTEFLAADLEPDLCIYYEGYNDLRNAHVARLAGDYSNFHGRMMMNGLGAGTLRWGSNVALLRGGQWLLRRIFVRDEELPLPAGENAQGIASVDPRALALYRRNLDTIAAVCRLHGWKVLFVPQMVMADKVVKAALRNWSPHVPAQDLRMYQQTYNEAMSGVAAQASVEFCSEVTAQRFGPDDFIDDVHLSPSGCKKFARALAPRVKLIFEAAQRRPGTEAANAGQHR
jgi:lysophospholipase L1-like esterase